MTQFYQKTPKQQATLYESLARHALSEWGLEGSALSVIKIRENAVFKVESNSGEVFAMRIHRAGYHSNESLRSEVLWMQALMISGVEVPEVIPTLDKRSFAVLDIEAMGIPIQVDLLAWVEGHQLGSVEGGINQNLGSVNDNFRTIGELAGRVHNQSSAWQIPRVFERHAWDVDGLVGDNPFWGRFWELESLSVTERDLMLKVRDRLKQDLSALDKSRESYGIIHADIVPENVLLDGKKVRLIDFDDSGYGWYLFDLATSLYFNVGEDCFNGIESSLIQGYRAVRPLEEEELERLPLFLLARGTTYLGWVHTRKETETAQELTPYLIELACGIADKYLTEKAP